MSIITIDTAKVKQAQYSQINTAYAAKIAKATQVGMTAAALETVVASIRSEWKAKLLEVNA